MNTITKTLLYLQMAAMLSTAVLAGPNKELPFRGSFQGSETYEFQLPLLLSSGTATGTATHLGRFTMTLETVSHFLPDNIGISSYHFIAANGDSLFVESSGQADATDFPVITVVETGTVTGGTGRFAGAKGSLTIEIVVVVTGPDSETISASLHGAIVLARGK